MNKHFYQSKKFWAAIIAAIVAGAREYGVDVPVELLWVIVAYIMGQGVADAGGYLGKNMPKTPGTQITLPTAQSVDTHTPKVAYQEPVFETGTWSPDSVSEDIGEANGTTDVRVDLDGLHRAFYQELESKGTLNNFTLYSRFQARANSYDLRGIPEHERVTEALRWNKKLIHLMRNAFDTFVGQPAPLKIADPRALLAEIKRSKPCGEYAGASERVMVYELWRLYQHEDALTSVRDFQWDRKFGTAKVSPWRLAECAKGGLL